MTDPELRRPFLPPHVAWPLFVVLLLAMSIGAAVYTFVVAQSDGGARVVEGYREPGR